MSEGHARERVAQADARRRIEEAAAGLDGEKEAAYGAVAACFRAAQEGLKALEEEVDNQGKERDEMTTVSPSSLPPSPPWRSLLAKPSAPAVRCRSVVDAKPRRSLRTRLSRPTASSSLPPLATSSSRFVAVHHTPALYTGDLCQRQRRGGHSRYFVSLLASVVHLLIEIFALSESRGTEAVWGLKHFFGIK